MLRVGRVCVLSAEWIMIKLSLVFFLVTAVVAHAGPDELDGLVGSWLNLRTELAAERLAWQEQEPLLRAELDLLEREVSTLQAEADAYAAESSEGEAEALVAHQWRVTLQAAHDDLLPVLDRTEAALRAWSVRIPAVLQASVESLFRSLPATPDVARNQSISERLQRVIALLSQMEILSQNLHRVQEPIVVGAEPRRLVDVLYIGLARAFAVSPDGTWAAIGTPGPDGWTWQPRPQAAADIRQALALHARQQLADFVELPLQVLEVAP